MLVACCNNQHCRESPNTATQIGACFGKDEATRLDCGKLKAQTIRQRRLQQQKHAALPAKHTGSCCTHQLQVERPLSLKGLTCSAEGPTGRFRNCPTLKPFEEENSKLKRLVADVMLETVVLKDLLGKPRRLGAVIINSWSTQLPCAGRDSESS